MPGFSGFPPFVKSKSKLSVMKCSPPFPGFPGFPGLPPSPGDEKSHFYISFVPHLYIPSFSPLLPGFPGFPGFPGLLGFPGLPGFLALSSSSGCGWKRWFWNTHLFIVLHYPLRSLICWSVHVGQNSIFCMDSTPLLMPVPPRRWHTRGGAPKLSSSVAWCKMSIVLSLSFLSQPHLIPQRVEKHTETSMSSTLVKKLDGAHVSPLWSPSQLDSITGPHNLRSFLAAKSTKNYFLIAHMLSPGQLNKWHCLSVPWSVPWSQLTIRD